jgi:hypothetical protein
MVLEFGNGTTLASPYSKVWRISFSPASNQTIGNIPTGAVPPSGGGAITPPSGATTTPPGAVPPSGGGAITPPSGGAVPPSGGGATTTPPPGGGAVPPSGGGGEATPPADEDEGGNGGGDDEEVGCDEDTENPVDTDGDGIIDTCEPI